MNEWETRMFYMSRIASGRSAPPAYANALAECSYDDVLNEYHAHFSKYCTDRERKYGGLPNAWSKGGTYAGVSIESVESVETFHAERAEVVVGGGLFPGQAFKFVLFAKATQWRIDNAFTREMEGDEWVRHHL